MSGGIAERCARRGVHGARQSASERRAWDSNPQPLAGHHISSVAAGQFAYPPGVGPMLYRIGFSAWFNGRIETGRGGDMERGRQRKRFRSGSRLLTLGSRLADVRISRERTSFAEADKFFWVPLVEGREVEGRRAESRESRARMTNNQCRSLSFWPIPTADNPREFSRLVARVEIIGIRARCSQFPSGILRSYLCRGISKVTLSAQR